MNDEITPATPSDIERQLTTVTAAITGLMAKPQENTVKAVGHIVQSGLQGKFLLGFHQSLQFLVDEGRVSPDYLNTIHGLATFREVVRALELDDVDEARFEAVRNIFINDALSDADRNEVLEIRLMKTAATLTGGQILILKVLFEDSDSRTILSLINDNWESELAESTGLKHRALIKEDVAGLKERHLLSDTGNPTNPPALTSLGRELCQYIQDPNSGA